MMKRFITPKYQDTFRFNWEFEEYNDKSEFFLELDYFINRENFVTRVRDFDDSPILDWNITARNGKKIFRNFDVSRYSDRGYRLINENVEVSNADEDILRVTELYGYAPKKIFTTQSFEIVSFLGHTDYGDPETPIARVMPILDANRNGISFRFLNKGDEAYFHRPMVGVANNNLISDIFTLDRDGHAPNPSWTSNSGASFSSKDVIDTGVAPYLYLYKRTIPAKGDIVNVKNRIEYFTSKPDIIMRTKMVDSLGNEVSDATDATFAEDAGLFDGKYVIKDAQIEYRNGLWIREVNLTDWKVF